MSQAIAVKSADRALELLELFAEHPDGLTLTDVSERTGWPKSSSLALLRTLQQRDFLEISSRTGRYRLGPRVAALGSAYLGNISLAQDGADIVRGMSRACDETVHLAVLRGTDVLYVAKEEGGGHMRMVSMVGRMIPAHGTGVGKMLLASLPPEELDRLYPVGIDLPRLTDHTVTDRAAFVQRLGRIREMGYATDSGESTVGVQCLAAPVLDINARVIAAMSISVPEPRFTEDRISELFSILVSGARQLSIRMGCPPGRLADVFLVRESEVPVGVH
ncbi:MAG: IclR family transcriptional regulator [Chloroflexota bacterium]|nr:IclR family transcriptional regulator [Chloroflexota bacterium]